VTSIDPVGVPGGDKETEVEPGQHKDSGHDGGLGKATLITLAIGLFAVMSWNIVYDAQHDGYEGYPVTLLLGGLLGGLVGIRRIMGGGDK